jgi:hypothetical protein
MRLVCKQFKNETVLKFRPPEERSNTVTPQLPTPISRVPAIDRPIPTLDHPIPTLPVNVSIIRRMETHNLRTIALSFPNRTLLHHLRVVLVGNPTRVSLYSLTSFAALFTSSSGFLRKEAVSQQHQEQQQHVGADLAQCLREEYGIGTSIEDFILHEHRGQPPLLFQKMQELGERMAQSGISGDKAVGYEVFTELLAFAEVLNAESLVQHIRAFWEEAMPDRTKEQGMCIINVLCIC